MITVSKEDYLKAILEAEGEGEPVIAARLAHWLSVSAPAVTMALRRLKRDGLVSVRSDGRVQLTAEGRKIARRLAIRHHLIERMLHEVFGMAWYKVHDEAERLEHAVSSDFEALLARKLGRGGPCPHGNSPTPEIPTQKRKRGLLLLSEIAAGQPLCGAKRLRARSQAGRVSGEAGYPPRCRDRCPCAAITTTRCAWPPPPGRCRWVAPRRKKSGWRPPMESSLRRKRINHGLVISVYFS